MKAVVEAIRLNVAKVQPPVTTDHIMSRDLLVEMLVESVKSPLTTLVAPAGYGKTSAIIDWINQANVEKVAWYNLDPIDSQYHFFLRYLVFSIEQNFQVNLYESKKLVVSPYTPSVEKSVQVFLDELRELNLTPLVVLDNFENINAQSVVPTFLECLCMQIDSPLNLILSSRHKIDFLNIRQRLQIQPFEINQEHLRFSNAEAEQLIEWQTGKRMTNENLKVVQSQLKGWAVGLSMYSAIRKRDAGSSFITGISSSESKDLEQYLFDEVLSDLNDSTVRLLMMASIPNRFSSNMLSELINQTEIAGNVVSLKHFDITKIIHHNLFVNKEKLDGDWYSFHPIFRELLRKKTSQVFSQEDIAKFHHIASCSFEQYGTPIDAIQEALAENDEQHAVELVVNYSRHALDNDWWYEARELISLLPIQVLLADVELLLIQVWVAGYQFDPQKCSILFKRLSDVVKDSNITDSQRAQLEIFTGQEKFFAGNFEKAKRCFQYAFDVYQCDTPSLFCGEALVFLCMATHLDGEPGKALDMALDARKGCAGHSLTYSTRVEAALCYLEYFSLKPLQSLESSKLLQMIGNAAESKYATTWGLYMQSLLAFNTMKRGDALRNLELVIDNLEFMEARMAIDTLVTLAIEHALCGNREKSTAMLGRMEDFSKQLENAEYLEVANSGIARVNLILGNVEAATNAVQLLTVKRSINGFLFWNEEPSLTMMRIEVASGNSQTLPASLAMLSELKRQIKKVSLDCYLVDVLLIEAFAYEKSGQRQKALDDVIEALSLAAPAFWSRPFVELGREVHTLLVELQGQGYFVNYIDLLFRSIHSAELDVPVRTAPPVDVPTQTQLAKSDLTNRESDILDLLGKRYQNKEIANELFISIHTVNYHLKNIYQKLGVSSRREAVKKIQAL